MRGQPARVQPMANGETPLAWSRADMHPDGITTVVGANGQTVLPHNAGFTPTFMFIEITASSNNYTHSVIAKDGTNFTVQWKNASSGAVATSGQALSFWWLAIQ